VLAILVVLTVQLSFSVKVEESIVRNTEDDSAMELAAVRGGIHFVGALFRDDRKNGVPPGDLDTAVDIWCDPNTADQRRLTIGDVELTVEIEDLERRLPLAWLADEQRKDLAEVALRRLIQRLAPIEGDPAALAKQVADRVRELEGVEFAAPAEGAAPAPAPAPTAGEGPRPRRFTSLEQLLGGAAAPADGSAPPPADGSAPAAGIDRKLLYGDPEADPPKVGIAGFVTTWPVPQVNLNTVSAEVLFALLPEKNKADEPLWDEADAIVEGIRRRRVDPLFQQAPADGSTPPPTSTEGGGGQGASQQWTGTPFTNVDELQSAEIHAKLGKIFTNPDATPPPGGGGGGGTPGVGGGGTPGVGGGGGTPATEEAFGFKNLLTVKSRYYMVRVTARRGGEGEQVEASYRLMVMRSATDEVSPLFIAEAGAR
jgi:hypothetical protein